MTEPEFEAMQSMTLPGDHAELHLSARRPTTLELLAAGLLIATIALHIAAMFPHYFGGPFSQGSLWSQPDQAALYSVIAAVWAAALAIGVSGPSRAAASAAFAVGAAAVELGLRVSDLGYVFRYGTAQGGTGLWLMTAAWVVGAAAAAVATLAAWRYSRSNVEAGAPAVAGDAGVAWAATAADSGATAGNPTADSTATFAPADPTESFSPADPTEGFSPAHPSEGFSPADPTESFAAADPTETFAAAAAAGPTHGFASVSPAEGMASGEALPSDETIAEPRTPRPSWNQRLASRFSPTPWPVVIVVALLAAATAGTFLPAWDHYSAVATSTGRRISENLGDAFNNPWQVSIGNVLVALALLAVPIAGLLMRHRKVGWALTSGGLAILGSQFVSAVVQAGRPVSAESVFGISPDQAQQLGLVTHLDLTAWFSLCLIAAFALFVVVTVLTHLRHADDHASAGAFPSAPDARMSPSVFGP